MGENNLIAHFSNKYVGKVCQVNLDCKVNPVLIGVVSQYPISSLSGGADREYAMLPLNPAVPLSVLPGPCGVVGDKYATIEEYVEGVGKRNFGLIFNAGGSGINLPEEYNHLDFLARSLCERFGSSQSVSLNRIISIRELLCRKVFVYSK